MYFSSDYEESHLGMKGFKWHFPNENAFMDHLDIEDQNPRMRSRRVIDILMTGIPYAHSFKEQDSSERMRRNRNTNAIAQVNPTCIPIITPNQ